MIRLFIRVLTILAVFFLGSYLCKSFLDASLEADFKKSYFASLPSKFLTRLLLLNKKIAISQFYQFQMISYNSGFVLPEEDDHHDEDEHEGGYGLFRKEPSHEGDPIRDKMMKVVKKYMLTHLNEFYDYSKFYELMRLALEFNPDNYFTRMFGTQLSKNSEMMQKAVLVLEDIYKIHPTWDLAFDIGWFNFYCLRKEEEARKWFKAVKNYPNAPRYAFNMYAASFILEKKYDQAVSSIENELKGVTDEKLKGELQKKLDWFLGLSLLSKKSVEYKSKYGKTPGSLEELVKTGLIPKVPEDPIGQGYYWDEKHQEPASRDNPFDLVQNRNPMNVGAIKIDG